MKEETTPTARLLVGNPWKPFNVDKERTLKFYQTIGANIEANRKRLKHTQETMSMALGISRVSLGNIESGKQRLPVHLIAQVCEYLGCVLPQIIPVNEPATPAPLSEQKQEGETSLYRVGRRSGTVILTTNGQTEIGRIHDPELAIKVCGFLNGQSQHTAKQIEEKNNEIQTLKDNLTIATNSRNYNHAQFLQHKQGLDWAKESIDEKDKQIDQYKARVGELEAEIDWLNSQGGYDI